MLGMTSVPARTDCREERLDEILRAGTYLGERAVHQKDVATAHAERLQLCKKHYNCNIPQGGER